MPTYLEAINNVLAAEAAQRPDLVQFGENIAHGSKICGLARHLTGRVVTAGNCENTHVGAGLGMMLAGGRALLVVKQLDFLLLAVDQMVNTMGLVRAMGGAARGSFTIVTIVCDQGYQGPQSSFNDLAGLCALTRLDGYHLNTADDAARILPYCFDSPGFRIVAVSQRQFPHPALDRRALHSCPLTGCVEVQYAEGSASTVVSLGFTLAQAFELVQRAASPSDVFHVDPVWPHQWPEIAASAARTRRLVVLDDSKGAVSLAHKVSSYVLRSVPGCEVRLVTREQDCEWAVNADRPARESVAA